MEFNGTFLLLVDDSCTLQMEDRSDPHQNSASTPLQMASETHEEGTVATGLSRYWPSKKVQCYASRRAIEYRRDRIQIAR